MLLTSLASNWYGQIVFTRVNELKKISLIEKYYVLRKWDLLWTKIFFYIENLCLASDTGDSGNFYGNFLPQFWLAVSDRSPIHLKFIWRFHSDVAGNEGFPTITTLSPRPPLARFFQGNGLRLPVVPLVGFANLAHMGA